MTLALARSLNLTRALTLTPALTVGLTLALSIVLAGGCATDGFSHSTWTPFGSHMNHRGKSDAVRFAIVDSNEGVFDTAEWAFIKRRAPWDPLARSLGEAIGRRIAIRQFKPFQIVHHLSTNECEFALITNDILATLRQDGIPVRTLATPEVHRRQGLIVAGAGSGIRALADLKGRRFAFGPRTDPVLFYSALEVLDRAGVSPSDLEQEFVITGFEGSLQHHPSSHRAAREIVYGLGTDAGVISADEYMKFPDTGGRWLPLFYTFSKDQFVILGRTELVEANTIRDAVVVASQGVADELVRQVQEYLVRAHVKNPEALHALGYARFAAPAATEPSIVAGAARARAVDSATSSLPTQ